VAGIWQHARPAHLKPTVASHHVTSAEMFTSAGRHAATASNRRPLHGVDGYFVVRSIFRRVIKRPRRRALLLHVFERVRVHRLTPSPNSLKRHANLHDPGNVLRIRCGATLRSPSAFSIAKR
jgi:hypothetical protein